MDLTETLSYNDVYDNESKHCLAKEFSRIQDECYVDHAGATLYSNSQIKDISDNLLSTIYANPHSAGAASSFTYDSIESVRYRILNHFHTTSEEYTVIFTSGATAAIKLIAETFKFGPKNGHFVYTQDNHTSVLGMRELVKNSAKVVCIPNKKLPQIFSQFYTKKKKETSEENSSLFVYSAQCNFSGLKLPLNWIEEVHNGALQHLTEDKSNKWYVLLDAAAYCATNDLDLSVFKPDFVCLSFYKMFGYPTGIGALLVRNSSADILHKQYYGGGTVNISLSSAMFHIKRSNLHERFEDGTVSFLSIVSLHYGFEMISTLTMKLISKHVFSLARHLHHSLMVLHHRNGQPVIKFYADNNYENQDLQGGIVTFNVLRSNGEFVGYMEVLNMAALYKISLRTGCFCNPGACQRYLELSNNDLLENYDAGYVCGGSRDLINGKPTGAVRISFGYMSTLDNVKTVLKMIKDCFVEGPEITKLPSWWNHAETSLNNKYCIKSVAEKEKNCAVQKNKISGSDMNSQNEMKSLRIENGKRECIAVFSPFNDVMLNTSNEIRLKRLFIYPVKSCAAFEINDSWVLGNKGLKYDREWMVVTSSGVCLSQKLEINLCLLKPNICLDKRELILSYPGMPDISVPLDDESEGNAQGEICRGKICGHKVEGKDCGINVSEWLSLALGRPKLRLIKQSSDTNKSKDSNKPELSFVSQAQYLLINEASISWLANIVPEDADFEKSTILYRFRGNIVISGCEPFDESSWTQIRIGKSNFQVDGPCTRCQMICIDQTTGKKTVEPLRSLASAFSGKIRFGVYLSRTSNTEVILNIGDIIEL